MSTEARVSILMQTDWVEVTPDMPIRRAAALLVEGRAAAAVVVDQDGLLTGILSQKDCFKPALYASYYQEWKGRVEDSMSRAPMTCNAEDDLITAAEAFSNSPHRVFPVVEEGRVVGMLRRSDVLGALMDMG
ncbi:CBS domain-containing protein [Pseudooceanicola sp. 200-1SW]|uniref:CBS domain-containing protein n=1 Tax=Pseudooceanicola sp. 200-1SW TaxID=3425949 RepID=UPI003D7F3C9C